MVISAIRQITIHYFGLRPGLRLPVRVGFDVFSGIAQAFPNLVAPSILPF
jgi:hypothetical protein